MKNKIELLAPAGNYESFLAAILGGADAVYLGGQLFGARAYAHNFNEEEIIRAIRYAHLYDRKVYLTMNTLVKEHEFHAIYSFLSPFYVAGLDGVIVQDFGIVQYLRSTFPDLEIHASTQMAITGSEGVSFLENQGIRRVVLARELSLKEIDEIKKKTNLELEIFIHGAMCYSLSGQCLFSSFIGGRSGNRGRCAGTCRLPYHTDEQTTCYPFSMKDQCAISYLQQLIQIGVDSLKIEGRMKRPEYVYKVTSIYRRYIDQILKNPNVPVEISEKDKKILESLYVRGSIQDGYFEKKNGRDMISIKDPSYHETKESLLKEIQDEMTKIQNPIILTAEAYFYIDQPSELHVHLNNKIITVHGDIVQKAKNQPLKKDKILEQLLKTNDTPYLFSELEIFSDEEGFLPVSKINELRRNALDLLSNYILSKYNRYDKTADELDISSSKELRKKTTTNSKNQISRVQNANFSILIMNIDQLSKVLSFHPKRVYIPIELYLSDTNKFSKLMNDYQNTETFLALPYILRESDQRIKEQWITFLSNNTIHGFLVRNLEELAFLKKINYSGMVQLDYTMYCMNQHSVSFFESLNCRWTYPLELNQHELMNLEKAEEFLVYGHIPVMISSNCTKKTLYSCDHKSSFQHLNDRKNNKMTLYSNCTYCYNVAYNAIPISLHKVLDKVPPADQYRFDFTIEDGNECERIISAFNNHMFLPSDELFFKEYTGGHFKRGID